MPRHTRNRHRKNSRSKHRYQHHNQRSHWLLKPSRARYLPAIIITLFASFIWAQPQFAMFVSQRGVLAYATDMSHSGLLSATNAQRSAYGVSTLTINSKLNSAAQAKANDMVNRDYWSHQTPDGQQPWVFIINAGYQYLAAGENLAYGFSTSNGAVTGWMNSPSHKANLLSTSFTEVGFGYANSANYVGNGPQTVVVAMYGKPQSPSPPPATQPAVTQQDDTPAPKPPAQQPKPAASQSSPQQPEEVQEVTEETPEEQPQQEEPIAIVADTSEIPPTAGTTKVQRVHLLTGGSAVWSATFVVLGICAIGFLWLLHRGFRFGKWLKASEKTVGKYLHLDLTVLSVVYLGFVLLQASGVVK